MLRFFKGLLNKRNKKHLEESIINAYRNDCLNFCDNISEHLKELNVERAVTIFHKADGSIDYGCWEYKKLTFIQKLDYTSLRVDGYKGLSQEEQSVLIDKCLDEHLCSSGVHNGNEKFMNATLYRHYLNGMLLQLGWEVKHSGKAFPMFVVNNGEIGGVFFYVFQPHIINEQYLNDLLSWSKNIYGREVILIVSPAIKRNILSKYKSMVYYLPHNRLHELASYIIHTT